MFDVLFLSHPGKNRLAFVGIGGAIIVIEHPIPGQSVAGVRRFALIGMADGNDGQDP